MTRRIHTNAVLVSVLALGFGCDPDAKLVGEGLREDDAPPADDVQWRVTTPDHTFVRSVVATSDGAAAILRQDFAVGTTRLERYAPDGTLTFAAPLEGRPAAMAVAGDDFIVLGESESGSGFRGTAWRISASGVVEATYVHPRAREANAFGRHVAVHSGEVAVVVGNWGGLDPGEPWFELVRLSAELEPAAPPLGFDNWVAGLGYDAEGELLVLETIEDGPDLVHRVDADESLPVDCQILMAGGNGPSLCSTEGQTPQVTMLDTGDVHPFDELDFFLARPTRGSSLVWAGMPADTNTVAVVELDESMAIVRALDIPRSAEAVGVSPSASAQAPDGAIYVSTLEHLDEVCEVDAPPCIRSQLLRIAPRD